MKLVHQQQSNREHPRPIYLLCVFRDEHMLLDYFIEYYRSLGVTHFIMIDNLSEDGGPEYLKSLQNINLRLYRAEDSYRDAAYGTRWVNQLLEEFCTGQYCMVVDVDELFFLDSRKYLTLHDLVDRMELSQSNAVPVTLLDMYPERTNDSYQNGTSFLDHSPFFDDLNETYYQERGEVYRTFAFKVGGIRQRIFGATVCITKFPFFKYDFHPLEMAPGYHFFQENGEVLFQSDEISLYADPGVLLHFKFIKPRFHEFVEKRVIRNEDWEDSAEYRLYQERLDAGEKALEFFERKFSKKLNNPASLDKFMTSSDK